ncbi:peptidoglycan-binding domain-containing protein [Isoptericola halotolerans]|uniref:peptidoglycan-binding domain-containing protein n=1 Tax=Isoptericola halotolerans TaxID=300560 RepID=UPI0038908A29
MTAALILLPGPVEEAPAQSTVGEDAVAVSTETYDGARQVSVRATVRSAESLTVADTGRVTASACEPGGTVESGDVPLVIDDRPAVALATDVPLWRDLQSGSRGEDVLALQEELSRLGHDLEPEGYFGEATRAAVRAVQEGAGVGRPDGVLASASVLWLPDPEVVVADCLAQVGDRVTDGEIATVSGGLTELTVVEPPGEGWVVRHDGHVGAIDSDGVVRDSQLLAAVEASEQFRQGQDEGTDRLTMEIALAKEIDVVVVPPSAIVPTGEGQGCVQTDDGEALRVEVVASSLGQTMVRLVDTEEPRPVRLEPDGVDC